VPRHVSYPEQMSAPTKKKKSSPRPRSAPTRSATALARRPTGTFRFSERFINTTTTVLIVVMCVMLAGGFILGFVGDNFDGELRVVLGNVAVASILGGIVLPLLIAAVLGGEAIRAGGGALGFFLIAGLFATVAGSNELGQEMLGPVWTPWALWGGAALMVLAGAGFWIIGWIAKVPMWIQAPFVGSPRVYVRGSSRNPADTALSNKLTRRRRSTDGDQGNH
jgi:hypothetical protein